MTVLFIILGAIIGAVADQFRGVLFGAIIGYLLADRVRLRERLLALDKSLKELARQPQQAVAAPVAPAESTAANEAEPVEPSSASVPEEPLFDAPLKTELNSVAPIAVAIAGETALLEPAAAEAPPSEPAFVRLIRNYFTGGNLVVRIGIIVLFFGVAFLLKYAAEHSEVPIEVRLAGIALGGVALLVFGWRLRQRKPTYALALQGGAVGILYLTVFAALRLYHLLPAGAAFALLAAIGALSAILAVRQDAQVLAAVGAAGGFLAPILTSTGAGSHVMLFSYYALLNAGILGIAWFKAWRSLNLLGFVFTFVIATFWGVTRYQPELFASIEPFLILFFVFFVAIAVLYAYRQAPQLKHYVDGTLIFGTPVVAFGLQSGLMRDTPYGLAFSAVALSAFYLLLAGWLYGRHRDQLRLLVEAFLALGVAFATLAVPMAFDGQLTAATWALEGAAILWVGLRQERRLARAVGMFLQFAAGLAFLFDFQFASAALPVLNSHFLGALMVSAAGLFSGRMVYLRRTTLLRYESPFAALLFYWGLLWWLGAGFSEMDRYLPDSYLPSAGLLFVALTAALCGAAARRLDWTTPRLPALCLLPLMVLSALIMADRQAHPLAYGGFIAWPIAFATFYRTLWQHEAALPGTLRAAQHVLGLWLLAAIASWECAWAIDEAVAGSGSWPLIAWAVVPCVALALLPRLVARLPWPVGAHTHAYVGVAGCGLAIFLFLWSLITNLTAMGDSAPLPYLPLLNPLDIAQALAFLAIIAWLVRLPSLAIQIFEGRDRRLAFVPLAGALFIWLNAILLRTLHHWAGVPFDFDAMTSSTLVHMSLSIFWSLLALATMLWATRIGRRPLWFVGVALMGVVVLKLFVIDLSSIGTVERIVSFIVVGLLMLVIGYFSPLPPAMVEEKQ
jgi:uncharacterized membrane protein